MIASCVEASQKNITVSDELKNCTNMFVCRWSPSVVQPQIKIYPPFLWYDAFFLSVFLCLYPVPQESGEQPLLPKVEVDHRRWSQWLNGVRGVAEVRTGLETVVVCAFITAMHHPSCKLKYCLPFQEAVL